MSMTAVIQLSFEPDWFRLDSRQRMIFRAEIAKILKSSPGMNCRWFDSEPWTGSVAEFFVCQFGDLHEYWRFGNELREHPVFRNSWARILRVSLGARQANFSKDAGS